MAAFRVVLSNWLIAALGELGRVIAVFVAGRLFPAIVSRFVPRSPPTWRFSFGPVSAVGRAVAALATAHQRLPTMGRAVCPHGRWRCSVCGRGGCWAMVARSISFIALVASSLLWRFHSGSSHSSEHLDFLAAARHQIDGILTRKLAQNLPAVALGGDVSAPDAGWTVLHWRNGRSSFLEHSLATPDRWPICSARRSITTYHHAKGHGRSNFGNLAPWLDVVFGTLACRATLSARHRRISTLRFGPRCGRRLSAVLAERPPER